MKLNTTDEVLSKLSSAVRQEEIAELEQLEPVKEEPKFGTKEWFETQVWTKAFRKAFGLKLTPFKRDKKKLRRNEVCDCGSGIKYKRCCGK